MIRLLLVLVLLVGVALGAPVPCTDANLDPGVLGGIVPVTAFQGCLTAPIGLNPNPDPGPWDDFFIAWDISAITGGYSYSYTFSDPGGSQKKISHAILGLSENCTTATTSSSQGTNCIWDMSQASDGQPRTFSPSDPGNSNPGLPGSIWGIKWGSTETEFSVDFNSDRAPVWQNAYLKDGTTNRGADDVYVYNTGFGASGLSYYVAAPDTVSVVPEPGFYGLVAFGLGGLFFVAHRRRAADKS